MSSGEKKATRRTASSSSSCSSGWRSWRSCRASSGRPASSHGSPAVAPRATWPMAELLVWPALIAYGEAAFAYAGELRGHGRYGRLGIWGVRIELARPDGLLRRAGPLDGRLPVGTWAGALNFLAWLVVSGYLIWGCRPRYRLMGLAVMPVAVGLLALAWVGGGTGVDQADDGGWALAGHAVLILVASARFDVGAAGASLLYLYEERRLKRRDTGVLRPATSVARGARPARGPRHARRSGAPLRGIVAGPTQLER